MTVTPAVDAKVLVVIKEKARRRLSRLVKKNRRQTVAQLTPQYNAGPSTSVSEHTVARTLLDMGLGSRRPTRVPLLTKCHRHLRLQWAREHRDWTMGKWKRVAWSDESRFLIHHVDGRVRVLRLPGEQLLLIHRLVVVVLCFGERSHGRLWDP
ncbi:hypothetical protein AVEN_41476-1 [Araneus ventricosus]|uniref:Transposase Tc1-like domain-containing protein n=1 Tax=Araneus ventricosus TaxID=182803 RepID=A0A4Y2F4A5_ARAVE|nr:hypothetical protein AVEN_41476-1 [Araneus ventricosus]